MKNKQANTGKHQKDNKDLKTLAVLVPPTATELSEEDLKKVIGGVSLSYEQVQFKYTQQKP